MVLVYADGDERVLLALPAASRWRALLEDAVKGLSLLFRRAAERSPRPVAVGSISPRARCAGRCHETYLRLRDPASVRELVLKRARRQEGT